jgi:hypothetical protein
MRHEFYQVHQTKEAREDYEQGLKDWTETQEHDGQGE